MGTTAVIGAMTAPFAFVWPVARLWWLLTGRRLPHPLGRLFPPPRVLVDPFRGDPNPSDIRELLKRPEYNWEPEPGDVPRWLNAWGIFGQVLGWELPPKSIASVAQEQSRSHRSEESTTSQPGAAS
jgi:hypothetical protein